ncbi:hypothetical protein Tco_0309802 [Tanacetum coccineum]
MSSDKKIVLPKPRLPTPFVPRLPSPPSPITQTQNRFIHLTPYPPTTSPITRPTYSALAHMQGISQDLNRLPTPTSPINIPRSPSINPEFQVNPNKQVIKILEPIEEQKLNQSFNTLLEYLYPQDTNFYTNDYQTREYYEAVLVDSKSIQVRHNYNREDPTKIDFSKVKNFKVLSPEDWNNRPFTNKVLSCYQNYPGYNYYDYVEAWNKAFLYKAHFHTWFFHFSEDFPLKYPKWFVKWYSYMGTLPETFPQSVLAGFNQYKILFKQDGIPLFEYTLQFSATFKLPWILSFTHKKKEAEGTSPPLLVRQFSVKWWKVIKESQADKLAIDRYHKSLMPRNTSVSSSSSSSSLTMTNKEIAQKIKDYSNNETLLEKFINEIRGSPTPSENLFQDAQDPYEDEDILNM